MENLAFVIKKLYVKFKFSFKNLSRLFNISFAYTYTDG